MPPSSLLTQSSTDPKEAVRVGGAQAGGTALSGGDRRPRRDERDRRGPPQQGEPPDGAHVAAPLCRRRHGRPGRQEFEARELSAPDGPGRSRPEWSNCAERIRDGVRGRSAPSSPKRVSPRSLVARRSIAPWCAITCSSRHRASDRGPTTSAGSAPFHGAVADGRRRTLPSRRRHRGQGRHRRRRPLTVLRLCPGGGPGDGQAGVRSAPVGAAHPWRPRPDSDRQWQGLHQSLRPRARTGAFRPDLRQQRHPPSAHRTVFTDDDGQGRALPQDHALGLLGRSRPSAPEHRRAPVRPRRMGGRVQHEAPAPVAGRSSARRALRPGRQRIVRPISRCHRSPTRLRSRRVRPA